MAYPGELAKLKIVSHDEQHSTTTLLVEILSNLTKDNSVSTWLAIMCSYMYIWLPDHFIHTYSNKVVTYIM